MGAEALAQRGFFQSKKRDVAHDDTFVPEPVFESRPSRDFLVQSGGGTEQPRTTTHAMMSMPLFKPRDFVPDRSKFTFGRICGTAGVLAFSGGAIGVGAVLVAKSIYGAARTIGSTVEIASIFGMDMFTDIAPEFFWGLAGSVTGIFATFCIAMTAIAKATSAIGRTTDEWYKP